MCAQGQCLGAGARWAEGFRQAHHGQVAQVLADLTSPLRGLQLQPLSRLFLPIRHGAAAVMAAVARRGVEAGLEELPPLPQLRIPARTQHRDRAVSGRSAVAWPGLLAIRGNVPHPSDGPPKPGAPPAGEGQGDVHAHLPQAPN